MAFATADDVATRLGRALTSAEEAFAEAVIAQVTGLIADAVDRDIDWADALDPVPQTLSSLCIEKVVRIGANPSALQRRSEQLGSYQHSEDYSTGSAYGVCLTDAEEVRARRAVYGATTATTEPESMIDRAIDLAENRDVDIDP
jgi:hypothetical protein